MAQPVWVLSVDLQTKTATFQTGLAEAARSARGAFGEIRSGAGEMAVGVHKGSIDVRHSLGLVDNVIRGAHAQAMADLVRMYAQSALVMNTLPIAAAAAGLALIGGIAYEAAKHVEELKAQQEQLADDFRSMGTAGNNALASVNDKLLTAEQRADELRGNYLAALQKQLELINHQSLAQLIQEFHSLQKAVNTVFKDLQANWYSPWDSGSTGAAHALKQFTNQYEYLISLGDKKGAADLLQGTLDSAMKIKNAQLALRGQTQFGDSLLGTYSYEQMKALAVLQQAGIGYSDKEVQAQTALIDTLEKQLAITQAISQTQKQDSANATTEASHAGAARRAAAAKEAAQSQLAMGSSALAGEKAMADAALTIHHASLEQRLASDMDFASREYQMKLAANQADIAALNKSGADYLNELKALNDKKLELEQSYDTEIAELKAKASVAINQRDVQSLEQGIRAQIDATREGTAARLAAINAGIREEQARQLQNSSFYRDLLLQEVQTTRQMAEEQTKQQTEAGREAANHTAAMQELSLTGLRQYLALYDSAHRTSWQQRVQQEMAVSEQEFQIRQQAFQAQIAALDRNDKDYLNKLKALQDKETQLVRQYELEITQIKDQAEEARNQRISSSESRMLDATSQALTASIMHHRTWAQTLTSLSNQVLSSMTENALKDMVADDMTRERDAAYAARKAFIAGMHLPFPANLIAAPALAAGAFASVMAFEGGTDRVPGVGCGDIVPAKLEPGEGVVPGGVMDGLRNVARHGGFEPRTAPIVHAPFAPQIHVMDAEGLDRVLTKHQQTFHSHVERAVRRVNH